MLSKEELNNIFEYKNGDLIRKKTGKIINSSSNGYLRARINKKNYFAHRIIFMMNYGFVPKIIDHINGNPSDNRIINLFVAWMLFATINKFGIAAWWGTQGKYKKTDNL
jgi:hypothetical protein